MHPKISVATLSKWTNPTGISLIALTLIFEFLIIMFYHGDQSTVMISLFISAGCLVPLFLWLDRRPTSSSDTSQSPVTPKQGKTADHKLILTPPRTVGQPNATNKDDETPSAPSSPVTSAPSLSAERLVLRPPSAEPAYKTDMPIITATASTSERVVLTPPITEPGYKYSSPTGRFFCYLLPKGDEPTERCEDSFDFNDRQSRYAVTDGVSQSFLPARWAQILAHHFVNHRGQLQSETEFATWLQACSDTWHEWVSTKWIPDANRKMVRDWSEQLYKGAQSTLVGCTLFTSKTEQGEHTQIEVVAIGDSNFFLLHPPSTNQQAWQYRAFPHTQPEEFGSTPQTLPSTKERITRTWQRLQDLPWHGTFKGETGDFILLTSDALAKWLIAQLLHGQHDWIPLLYNMDQQRFCDLMKAERKSGRMEDDDVTALVISL